MNRYKSIKSNPSIFSQSSTDIIKQSTFKLKLFTVIQNGTKQDNLDQKESSNRILLKCPYCHKNYNSVTRYEVHFRTHTGERPHECSYCNKKFNEKGNLKAHIRIHTGERPYKCTYEKCSMAFKTKAQLKDHFHRHYNFRPFNCDICNSSFNRKPHLKAHMKTHSKDISIAKCTSSISESTFSHSNPKEDDTQKYSFSETISDDFDFMKDSFNNPMSITCDLFNEYKDNDDNNNGLNVYKDFDHSELHFDQCHNEHSMNFCYNQQQLY